MKFVLLILAAVAVLMVHSEETKQFKNYKLLRLKTQSPETYKKMSEIELNDPSFDIWKKEGEDMSMDVMLSPAAQQIYSKFFALNKVNVETLVEDAQTIFDAEAESMRRSRNNKNDEILFKYARYDQIVNFVDDIVQKNSDIASSYLAGKTHEGRSLPTIVLKTSALSRKAIWIDCGIHAREWVSPATCVYIINQLINEYRNNDPQTVSILRKYEIHILPLLNPDGYEHTHTSYRLWRKNRSPNRLSLCPGTDLNRNFDNYWLQGGSSENPCSDVHAGKTPASELETQAVVRAINRKQGDWDAFISIHSYGQWWLTPYGYAVNGVPADYEEIKAKGQIGADAIKAYNGSVFVVGNSASLLYVNTGSSKDWAKDAGIKYSYVLELRPGPNTPDYIYGFALPEDRMPLVATETYLGIKAFINSIL